jgi:hypothetical protein
MIHGIQSLRAAILSIVFCSGLPLLAQVPDVSDWKVATPPNAVQLATVERVMDNVVKLSFKNTTEKTVVEFRVYRPDGKGPNETGTGLDAFTSGTGTIAPGATMPVTFGEKDSSGNQASHSLRIAAIVYSDGSSVGEKRALDEIVDEMVGAALEIKRDADLLAASPDPSLAGIDAAAEKIGRTIPSSDAEAVDSVRGIELNGIPQSVVDARVSRHSSGFLVGVNRARQMFLLDLNLAKSNAEATPEKSSQEFQDRMKQLQSHVLADLAGKWAATSQSQTQTLQVLLGGSQSGN